MIKEDELVESGRSLRWASFSPVGGQVKVTVGGLTASSIMACQAGREGKLALEALFI